MNQLSITSRERGITFRFWMTPNGGDIYLTYEGRPEGFGDPLCINGKFAGPTLTATPDTFEKACRKWYRDHKKIGMLRICGLDFTCHCDDCKRGDPVVKRIEGKSVPSIISAARYLGWSITNVATNDAFRMIAPKHQ